MKDISSRNKPRILIVTGVLWVGGGAERVAASLGNYLHDRGYETHLLTFYEAREKYPYHGIYHTFNERPKSRLKKILNVPLRIWKIYRYVRKHEINVAFTFLEEANFYTLLVKLLFRRHLPVIVSVRNNIRRRGWLFRKASHILYPYAHKVVSNTRALEHMLVSDFSLTNTETIYNPIDPKRVTQDSSESLPPEDEWMTQRRPLCISIGRLIHQKGQWHLIRAFAKVVEQHPTAQLVILSEGDLRGKLQQLIEDCGLEKHVYLPGNRSNVFKYLAAADVFVFSSLWEGMPNTMLEALSVGLSIVSTDCVSGPREIIAPELGVDEDAAYPYRSDYGILTMPQSYEQVWASPSKQGLDEAEQQLADTISQVLQERWFRSGKYTAYTQRVDAFAYDNVMPEWEGLAISACASPEK